jgi:hypothetical protein
LQSIDKKKNTKIKAPIPRFVNSLAKVCFNWSGWSIFASLFFREV